MWGGPASCLQTMTRGTQVTNQHEVPAKGTKWPQVAQGHIPVRYDKLPGAMQEVEGFSGHAQGQR